MSSTLALFDLIQLVDIALQCLLLGIVFIVPISKGRDDLRQGSPSCNLSSSEGFECGTNFGERRGGVSGPDWNRGGSFVWIRFNRDGCSGSSRSRSDILLGAHENKLKI